MWPFPSHPILQVDLRYSTGVANDEARATVDPPTFVVFKTATCQWCQKTMEFLQALHEQRGDFRVAAVDANEHPDEFRRAAAHTKRTTVPQIFLDGRFVGGWTELAAAAKKGHLDAYLDGDGTQGAPTPTD